MRQRRYTTDKIHYMDAGIFTLGNDELRAIVSLAFAQVPSAVVDQVMDECLIVMPLTREGGSYIPKNLLAGKALILFPETLLREQREVVNRTILHEIAHHILGHRSRITDEIDYDAQERAAWAVVDQWLDGGAS